MRERKRVLVGLFVALALLTTLLLWRVIGTVFFAITVAYVLYPVRRALVDRGVSRRVSAALATSVAFAVVIALVAPLLWAIYSRRDLIIDYVRALPDVIEIEVLGTVYTYDLGSLAPSVREALTEFVFQSAGAAAVIGMKAFLFIFLVYALLLRPGAAGRAVYRTVPAGYHEVARRFHARIRQTLYAIYVVQAATAFATFLAGLVVFYGLGYEGAFVLAIFGGILQFIPVLGPSLVIVFVAAGDVVAGDPLRAGALLAIGLFFVGFVPDAIIRPKLAPLTAGIPASLYFIGFTGGVLSLGLVGLIAGPLVIVLFVESVDLLAEDRDTTQEQLS